VSSRLSQPQLLDQGGEGRRFEVPKAFRVGRVVNLFRAGGVVRQSQERHWRQIINDLDGRFHSLDNVRAEIVQERLIKYVSHDWHVPAIRLTNVHRATNVAGLAEVVGDVHPVGKRSD